MKTNMKYLCVELNDLLDEILLIILKKLSNIEVLCSLQDANERLNRFIHDPIFASRLNFLPLSSNFISQFPFRFILVRFCSQILPESSMKIIWLDRESSTTMERILNTDKYSDLYGLSLNNIK